MILRYNAVHNDDLSLNINTFLCYKSIPLQYDIKKFKTYEQTKCFVQHVKVESASTAEKQ